MSDNQIWRIIGGKKNFCAYKKHSQIEIFCNHPNNVTKVCTEESCPLSNSKYATIREIKDKLYLFLKEPERANFIKRQYEIIELPEEYDEAITLIDKELNFFSDFLKHKCKQRLTVLTEYLERKKLKDPSVIEYTVHRRRQHRRELKMADRLRRTLNVEEKVQEELMERLKAGVYGNEIRELISDRTALKTHIDQKSQLLEDFEESDEYVPVKQLKKRKNYKYTW